MTWETHMCFAHFAITSYLFTCAAHEDKIKLHSIIRGAHDNIAARPWIFVHCIQWLRGASNPRLGPRFLWRRYDPFDHPLGRLAPGHNFFDSIRLQLTLLANIQQGVTTFVYLPPSQKCKAMFIRRKLKIIINSKWNACQRTSNLQNLPFSTKCYINSDVYVTLRYKALMHMTSEH